MKDRIVLADYIDKILIPPLDRYVALGGLHLIEAGRYRFARFHAWQGGVQAGTTITLALWAKPVEFKPDPYDRAYRITVGAGIAPMEPVWTCLGKIVMMSIKDYVQSPWLEVPQDSSLIGLYARGDGICQYQPQEIAVKLST